jgi:predicted AAA+ superfamily ATPase
VSAELGDEFDLKKMLQRGYIPSFYDAEDHVLLAKSYCADYLKLQPFSRFLEIAALGDTELLSFDTIARDCGVSAPTVKSYYEILADTLLGSFLRAYMVRPKLRQTLRPKFYFAAVGVVNTTNTSADES